LLSLIRGTVAGLEGAEPVAGGGGTPAFDGPSLAFAGGTSGRVTCCEVSVVFLEEGVRLLLFNFFCGSPPFF
ncbi:hypothetical protein PENTCL1PPCAC_24246, partial [Pristionchus entomophagus]